MKKGIVAYDIKITKYRTYLSEILKSYGDRVQYSIFEFNLTKNEYYDMVDKIKKFFDEYENYLVLKNLEDRCKSIMIYNICDSCYNKKVLLGNKLEYSNENIIII